MQSAGIGPTLSGPMEELIQELNPPQREAVTAGEGPVLVVAGPGSGKTRVITHRIAWLLSRGVPPWRIIAITFTNKAADEMRERVLRLVPAGSEAWISTFHSACVRILRREIEALGYKSSFTIYDTADRDRLLKKIMEEQGFSPRDLKPSALGRRISWFKNRNMGPGEHLGLGSEVDVILEKVWPVYQERMKAANALDFDDLLLLTLDLFARFPSVRDKWSGRFLHVLVDEFQDTNRIQYDLARGLSSTHGNIMVVGDPDQSIYGFRGAQVRNILDFEKDYPSARVVRLEQNYRSTEKILKAAGGVISNNLARKEKDLWTERKGGDPLLFVPASTAEEEALRVAGQVRSWMASGIPPGEIAVFYRVNARSRLLEAAFRAEGLEYRVVGALSFYQRREIKDILAWLKLVVNPFDEISFTRAVSAPPRGVGGKTLERILARARSLGVSPLDVAADPSGIPRITAKAKKGLSSMANVVVSLREEASAAPAVDVVRRALEDTGYLDWIHDSADPLEARDREANLEELLSAAAQVDERDPRGGLPAFLERVSLVSDQDALAAAGEAVQFMTLHTAKGLEFDAVAIVGLEEGTLPHAFSLDTEEGIEEERRLFYVGVTRARKHLLLSAAGTVMSAGEWREMMPSRFLEEIPRECFVSVGGGEEAAEDGGREAGRDDPLPPPPPGEGPGPGTRVRHGQYGEGVIKAVRGDKRNKRLVVDFGEAGTKILLLEYSELEFL